MDKKERHKQYVRGHYLRNKDLYKSRARTRNKRVIAFQLSFCNHYKAMSGCIDCGENDPIVLDFDHKNRKDKLSNVAELARRSGSLKRLVTEMMKCDIRCANCHRRKTHKEILGF